MCWRPAESLRPFRPFGRHFPIPVQVEVTTAEQAREVVAAGATDILLDNMTHAEMAAIVTELSPAATSRPVAD